MHPPITDSLLSSDISNLEKTECVMSECGEYTSNSAVYCGPSSSHFHPDADVVLDGPVLRDVIRSVVSFAPIAKVSELNEICSSWRYCTERALQMSDGLCLEVPMGNGKGIIVQGTRLYSIDNISNCMKYIISRMECLRELHINFLGSSLDTLDIVLDFLLDSANVHLKKLCVSARRGGMRLSRLSSLIAKCSSTLKEVGQIGVSELEDALRRCNTLDLDHLSLVTYDLLDERRGFDAIAADMDYAFARMQSGHSIRVRHFSAFVVSGFNPNSLPYSDFLKSAEVQSLSISKQTGTLFKTSKSHDESIVLPLIESIELEQYPSQLHDPRIIRDLFPALRRFRINSVLLPLRDLEHAVAYASEWLSVMNDVQLEGVQTAEIRCDYNDLLKVDKVRCHMEDLERFGARLRLLDTGNFCSFPALFLITNATNTFRFEFRCAADIWHFRDILN
ncbi:hypothetical protein AB6A40_003878 [Gnathostoma spinigerum]|uniref:F-box domain-containing protein n=1 Tax=Gnathostoma spinigerum TaxID=75299 RepID=A0ABD6EGB1_9BILA